MNNEMHKALQERYKAEADEHLFKDIYMDAALKERILKQAALEQQIRSTSKAEMPKWKSWKLHYFAPVAAAAIFMLVMIPTLLQEPDLPGEWVPESDFAIESVHHGSTLSTGEEPMDIFAANNEVDSDIVPGQAQHLQEWRYRTLDEAAKSFAGELVIPDLLPNAFILTDIIGRGTEAQQPVMVELRYETESQQWMTITANLEGEEQLTDSANVIETPVGQAYVRSEEPVQIYLNADPVSYVIEGNAHLEQLLEITRHLQKYHLDE